MLKRELIRIIFRQRKLERIAQLDSEVTQLKEENFSLSQVKDELQREAKMLRSKLQQHVDSGCVILTNNVSWNNKLLQH